MEDYTPMIGLALAPLAYWLIVKLLTWCRWLFNKILPDGKVKRFLMKEY
jgi:hypothetical protein